MRGRSSTKRSTLAALWLISRGLTAPYPSCVRFLPDARIGEGAIVGVLTTADVEVVGVQLGYIDPLGRKSVMPNLNSGLGKDALEQWVMPAEPVGSRGRNSELRQPATPADAVGAGHH